MRDEALPVEFLRGKIPSATLEPWFASQCEPNLLEGRNKRKKRNVTEVRLHHAVKGINYVSFFVFCFFPEYGGVGKRLLTERKTGSASDV